MTESNSAKNLPSLLEKMTSSDTDYRFMAINDLINDLQNDSLKLYTQNERQIVKVVLQLLRDANGEVQSLSVTALSVISKRVSNKEICFIVADLIDSMKTSDAGQVRSICGIALKSVISSISCLNFGLIEAVALESINPLLTMTSSHADFSMRIEACEILGEIVSRFGASIAPQHSKMIECLLPLLSHSHSPLRKRVVNILGALVWCASDESYTALIVFLLAKFETIVPSGGSTAAASKSCALLQQPALAAAMATPTMNADDFKTLLKALAVLVRNPQRCSAEVPGILQQIIMLLQNPSGYISRLSEIRKSSEEEADEIRELGIQVLDTLIRRSAWLVAPFLTQVIRLLLELLQHDPNYNYDADDDTMGGVEGMDADDDDDDAFNDEDEDNGYSDDDNEDISWKVRRTAAKALESAISSFPEYLADFYKTIAPVLINRFKERIESVRLDVFSCMSCLLAKTRLSFILTPISKTSPATKPTATRTNSTVAKFDSSSQWSSATWAVKITELQQRLSDPSSAHSLLLALLPVMVLAINRYISVKEVSAGRRGGYPTPKTSLVCRQTVFCLLRDLALALPGQMGPYISTILNLIFNDFGETSTTNTAKIELVNLLILLVRTHSSQTFFAHQDLLNKLTVLMISDSFYRVALDGMDLAQEVVSQRPKENRDDLTILFPSLIQQLKTTDCDIELKEKVVSTVAVYLDCMGDKLSKSELQQCFQLLLLRLKNETTRLITTKAIAKICTSKLNVDSSNFLSETITELAGLLKKNDRTLRIGALRCLSSICDHFPALLLNSSCLQTIFTTLPLLISDQDLQTSQSTVQLVGMLLIHAVSLDAVVAGQVADLVTSDEFMGPLVCLVHSTLLHGQTLDSLLFLMRCIGHFSPTTGGNHKLTIPFVLARLLSPLDAATYGQPQIAAPTPNSATFAGHQVTVPKSGSNSRDSLPYLACCLTELLIQLPRQLPVAGQTPVGPGPHSIQMAVDQLLAVVKDTHASPLHRYLNILVLGELGRKTNLSDRKDLIDLLLAYIGANAPADQQQQQQEEGEDLTSQSEMEIRPAAAVGLGRLVVGEPSLLLPFLLKTVTEVVNASNQATVSVSSYGQQLVFYYLLQALREALVNLLEANVTECIRANLDALWSLLLVNAGRPEEGSRNLVAECLGRIACLSPQHLVSQLQTQLNSPESSASALTRGTLVTAAKCILVVSEASEAAVLSRIASGNTVATKTCYFDPAEVEATLCKGGPPTALSDFLSRLLDNDVGVRRAALVTLNTAAHHRSGLVRPLLNQPVTALWAQTSGATLLQLLYGETVQRPELVREVQMGPFKHKEDDGLELRKTAYECMSTLLDTCVDNFAMSTFLETLVNGLKDHNDIKLLVYQMLQRIIQLRPLNVINKMKALAEPLKEILLSRPKKDQVKQEQDKMEELKRCAIVLIFDFRNLADIEKNPYYLDLIRTIEAEPLLNTIYDQVSATVRRSVRTSRVSVVGI